MTNEQESQVSKLVLGVLASVLTGAIIGLIVLYGEHSVLKAQVHDLRQQSIEREARTRALEQAVTRIGEELRAQNAMLRGIARQVGAPVIQE